LTDEERAKVLNKCVFFMFEGKICESTMYQWNISTLGVRKNDDEPSY